MSTVTYEIETIYIVNGTTATETIRCDRASVTMAGASSSHATVVRYWGGVDDRGRRVEEQLFRHAEVVTKRLIDHSRYPWARRRRVRRDIMNVQGITRSKRSMMTNDH